MSQLAHHVYFTLKDRSDEAIQALLEACNKYLDNHEGLVGFSLGTRDRELDRITGTAEPDRRLAQIAVRLAYVSADRMASGRV